MPNFTVVGVYQEGGYRYIGIVTADSPSLAAAKVRDNPRTADVRILAVFFGEHYTLYNEKE